MSHFLKRLWERMESKLNFNNAYHPINGSSNQGVESELRKYFEESSKKYAKTIGPSSIARKVCLQSV
jgi:hypothetical protein